MSLKQHAFCRFNADATTPTFVQNGGFDSTIVRNGAGDYTLELDADHAIDATELLWSGGLNEANVAGGGSMSCVAVDDTHVRITTSNGTALADLDFSLILWRVAGDA